MAIAVNSVDTRFSEGAAWQQPKHGGMARREMLFDTLIDIRPESA